MGLKTAGASSSCSMAWSMDDSSSLGRIGIDAKGCWFCDNGAAIRAPACLQDGSVCFAASVLSYSASSDRREGRVTLLCRESRFTTHRRRSDRERICGGRERPAAVRVATTCPVGIATQGCSCSCSMLQPCHLGVESTGGRVCCLSPFVSLCVTMASLDGGDYSMIAAAHDA